MLLRAQAIAIAGPKARSLRRPRLGRSSRPDAQLPGDRDAASGAPRRDPDLMTVTLEASVLEPPAPVVATVRSILAPVLGLIPRQLRFEQLSNAGSSGDFKTFWKVWAVGREHETFFVKHATKGLRGLEIHAYLTGRGLPTPDFIGMKRVGRQRDHVYVWRHVEGRADLTFRNYSPEDILRVARALAVLAARTPDVAQHVPLRAEMLWVGPKAKDIRAYPALFEKKKIKRAFRAYAKRETKVLSRLGSMPCEVLTHNDAKAPNIILRPDDVTIVDWDSATIGPHGASLRVFARHRDDSDVGAAEAYVQALAENGMTADPRDVLFTLRAQEVFWGLATGLKHGNMARIVRGLLLAKTAFADIDPS